MLRLPRPRRRSQASKISFLLPHLRTAWAVDRAIVLEEKRVVVIRFGSDADPTCMRMDEVLASIADDCKAFASVFLVDLGEVPDFTEMYELYEPCIMFFYRNKHIMVDLGTGNNNKLTAVTEKQDLIDIIEVVYRGASKGRGLVVGPKDMSTRYKY